MSFCLAPLAKGTTLRFLFLRFLRQAPLLIFEFHLRIFCVPYFPPLFFQHAGRIDDKITGIIDAEPFENGQYVFEPCKKIPVRGLFCAPALFRTGFQARIHLKIQLFLVGYPFRPQGAFHSNYIFHVVFVYALLQNFVFICVFQRHVFIANVKIKALILADYRFPSLREVLFHKFVPSACIIFTYDAPVRIRPRVESVVPAYECFPLTFQMIGNAFVEIKLQIFLVFQPFALYPCLAMRAFFHSFLGASSPPIWKYSEGKSSANSSIMSKMKLKVLSLPAQAMRA